MAKLTVDIDAGRLEWIEARIGDDRYGSRDDVIAAAFAALEREEFEDKAMYAAYGNGSIDDPEAIARGQARIMELIEEGENSGPATPWNLEEFLDEMKRDHQLKAA